jgi:hypothetical protein
MATKKALLGGTTSRTGNVVSLLLQIKNCSKWQENSLKVWNLIW